MNACKWCFVALLLGCGGTPASSDASGTDSASEGGSVMNDVVVEDARIDGSIAQDATSTDALMTDTQSADTQSTDTQSADTQQTETSVDVHVGADVVLSGPSCDQRRVLCDRIPPTCAMGEAPSVQGSCWGPCIPATMCVCTTAEECPRVPGYSETCFTRMMRCGPFL